MVSWSVSGRGAIGMLLGVLFLMAVRGIVGIGADERAIATSATIPTGKRDAPPSRRTSHASAAALRCGGIPFHPAALRRPRGYERRGTPAARALRAFLRRYAEEVGQPRHGWFLLAHRRHVIEFAAGRRSPFGDMTFERNRRRWVWAGSGGCEPRAYHDGLEANTWRLDPAGQAPSPQSTQIPVLVQEDACAGGRDARGRVLSPLVHYGQTAITVTYLIRPLKGPQTCQGVPPTPVTLILDEPVGNRPLRDGGTYPPARR